MLGPILFICYINSTPETVSSFLYMYADDTKVFRRVDVDGATTELQKDLHSLVEWSEKWQLRFNADKCKVMHIGGSRNRPMKAVYRMANSELHDTEEEEDLGVWIDNTGKPSCHVSHAVRKSKPATRANQTVLHLYGRSPHEATVHVHRKTTPRVCQRSLASVPEKGY